jgi:hypothetical protein
VVVGVAEMEDDVKQSTSKADKLETRELETDAAEIEQDAKLLDASRTPRTPTPKTESLSRFTRFG